MVIVIKSEEGDGSTRIGAVSFLVSAGEDVGVFSCRDPRDVWVVTSTVFQG